MDNIKQLVWRPEQRQVSEIKNWAKNPRKISKEALDRLKERITARGFHDVIKVDTDNTILSGNQRKKALVELDVKEVTVLVPSRKLTEEERNKVALESNTNDGEWDFEALKDFDLNTLTDVGFDQGELLDLWSESLAVEDDNFNVEKELAKIKEPKTKLGDLIILGPHRLICGDATDLVTIKRLLDGEKASMVYSDPVYNIGVDYNGGIGGKKNYGGHVKDNRNYEDYQKLLRSSIVNALSVSHPDTHVFYWCDQIYIGTVQALYRELGITNKRVCLWLKNGHNPTPGVAFNKCYEPCVYGVRGKPYLSSNQQSLNEVLNGETTTGNALAEEVLDHLDIWSVKRMAGKDMEHATSKPPKLHEKAIRRCTKINDIILDSFLGSGSTLIAGESLKRRVFGTELEPAFCDLIIKRYEKLTGIKAKVIREEG